MRTWVLLLAALALTGCASTSDLKMVKVGDPKNSNSVIFVKEGVAGRSDTAPLPYRGSLNPKLR